MNSSIWTFWQHYPLAVGFKEETGSEEEPTPGDGVVDIEDDEITREGDEVWRSFLVSLNASYPQMQHQSRAKTYYK